MTRIRFLNSHVFCTGHKSHIRNNVRSCELTTHFFDSDKHILNKKLPLKHFDTIIKEHLNIPLLDQLIFDNNSHITSDHKNKLLKER